LTSRGVTHAVGRRSVDVLAVLDALEAGRQIAKAKPQGGG
jgi:hypothetical protein